MTTAQSVPRRGGVVRNVIHLGLGQVATTVLTILLSATLARSLGASEFGLLYLLASIATFAYVVVDWGHGPYIIREAARHPERSGELLGSAIAVRSAMALLTCVVAVASTWLLRYDLHTQLLTGAMILGLLPQYIGLGFGWIFRGHERMDRDAAINVMLKLATLIGAVVCVELGGRLPGLIVVYAVAGFLTLSLAMAIYRKLQLPPLRATMSTSRELLRDGAPLLAMSLAVAVEPYFNANILYKMATPAVVGWYGAAWNIAGTLIAPATILGATMYPRLSTAASNPAEFKRVFGTSFRPLLLLAVLGAVGTYLFADVAIALIYTTQKFGPAADTLRAFTPVLLLMYVDVFFATGILAAGRAGRLASAKIAAVVLTTGLVVVLVPWCQSHFANGGLGVMYAMASGEFLMLVAAVVFIREAIDGHLIGDVLRSLLAGVSTVVVIQLLPPMTPFLGIPLCVVAFAGLALLVGAVTRADVDLVTSSLSKGSGAPPSATGIASAGTPDVSVVVDSSSDRGR
jgi:O-antigen/teichoic acid export membrane protein